MATPADAAARSKVLFWDTTVLSAEGLTNGAKLNVNRPEKLGRVISPESAWELAEVGGYDKVIQMGPQDYLFHYLCNADYRMSPQRVCLARSVDGLTWTKGRPGCSVISELRSQQPRLLGILGIMGINWSIPGWRTPRPAPPKITHCCPSPSHRTYWGALTATHA